ncbi:hypothetical protein PUT78_20860 [Roseinatronobacter sp. HJB301]|uniref:Uncharacterized protein n=1 Tax=Roseinatronobacter alkalisoli TaxID=3028235 RepID=A0ABT5TEH6_9RHOB|nr:hypothetical protein [Roseinatronobacter sp. HJB301]
MEQFGDERDFTSDAWLLVIDVAALDCSDRFYTAQVLIFVSD